MKSEFPAVHRKSLVAGLVLVVLAVNSLPALAAKTSSANNATINNGNISKSVTQSYDADSTVLPGMIVELKSGKANMVTALSAKDIKKMLGVVVPVSQAPIVLTTQNSDSTQVLVASTGRFRVLVSNQSGPIKASDFITISSLDGFGMKASPSQEEIIGRATTSFDGKHNVLGTVPLKVGGSHVFPVAIGTVTIDMELRQNPLAQKTVSYLPQFVVNAAVGIAQKPVSSGRIYLGTVLMFMTLYITSNMLYSGVRNGMVAIGRNPLSKKSVIRSLFETGGAGLLIFASGVFAVYLILKL